MDALAAWIDRVDGLGLFLDFFVKTTLMLALALAASACLQKRTAAQRFRMVWLAALGVPVFFGAIFTAAFHETWMGFSFGVPQAVPQLNWEVAKPLAVPSVSILTLEDTDSPTVLPLRPAVVAPSQRWQPLLLLVWAAGVALHWLRLLFSQIRMQGGSKQWVECRSGPAWQALRRLAASTQLRRTPRLVIATGWAMPATWGWLRPTILLPATAVDWPPQRLELVLTHELAHILRRDALKHHMARICLSFVWFHPLAWMANRKLAALREVACDDLVLEHSKTSPLEYVSELLHVVKEHAAQPLGTRGYWRLAPVGFAMAQTSGLQQRVRRLMASGINRRASTRGDRVVALGSWMAMLVCLFAGVSCKTVKPGTSLEPQRARLHDGTPQRKLTPAKAPVGAAKISYHILEIAVPTALSSPSVWRPFVEGINAPAFVPFDSLRFAGMNKGVDLLNLGDAAEGQKLEWSNAVPFRYADEFTTEGRETHWIDTQTGITASMKGQRVNGGETIEAEVELEVRELQGQLEHPVGDGKFRVKQPIFQSRKLPLQKLQIPNGGFVILNGPAMKGSFSQQAVDTKLRGFVKRTSTEHYTTYLAIAATSSPLPSKAGGTTPPVPKSSWDLLPKGTPLVNFKVDVWTYPRTKDGLPPITIPSKPISAKAYAELTEQLLAQKLVERTSYPTVKSLANRPVRVASQVNHPQATGKENGDIKVEYVPIGFAFTLTGKTDEKLGVVMQVEAQLNTLLGHKPGPVGPIAVVGRQDLGAEYSVSPQACTVCVGGLVGKKGDQEDMLLVVTATAEVKQ